MKKVLVVAIVIMVMAIVGCSEEPKETPNGPNDIVDVPQDDASDTEAAGETEEVPESPEGIEDAQEPAEDDIPAVEITFDDSSDDCGLLSAGDIKYVCGAATVEEEQTANIDQGQICIKVFKTDDPMKGMKIVYTGDNSRGGLAPETIAEGSCGGMKAEMIDDYSCYAETAGKTVFVFGKKRIVNIANTVPMEDYFVCSKEQLKELGKLVSDRLYE